VDNVLGFLSTLGTSPLTATLIPAAAKGDADAAGGLAAMGTCCLVPMIILGIVAFVGIFIGWKIFTKAGQPGWASIVPIYNNWVMVTEICKMEPLWFFLGFVPIGNIIAAWKICMELAKKFGKSDGFGVGLFLLGPIFAAILAFGDARYQGRSRSRYDDDDDEDEDEEEEEERPKKKKRRDEDDEDEDDRPRKKRRDDD
jgi:hypothetical protein